MKFYPVKIAIIILYILLSSSCEGFKDDLKPIGCCETRGYGFDWEGYYVYECNTGSCDNLLDREGEGEIYWKNTTCEELGYYDFYEERRNMDGDDVLVYRYGDHITPAPCGYWGDGSENCITDCSEYLGPDDNNEIDMFCKTAWGELCKGYTLEDIQWYCEVINDLDPSYDCTYCNEIGVK